MKLKLLYLSAIAITVFLMLYEGQKGKLRMYADSQSMKKELLKEMPIGSLIHDAKKIMEENGFNCEMMENTAFSENRDGDPQKPIVHEGEDFLFCNKRETVGVLVIREWDVIIVRKGDVVSDVFVNVGLTGT